MLMIYVEPKPMKYEKRSGLDYDILFQAQDENGYKVLIVNYFTHPCAYIGLPYSHPYWRADCDLLDDISCHGGLTYSSDFHPRVKELCDNGWFIGWDYSHWNDYMSYYLPEDGLNFTKKWTTEEIIAECEQVIEQLENVKRKAYKEENNDNS